MEIEISTFDISDKSLHNTRQYRLHSVSLAAGEFTNYGLQSHIDGQ